MEQMQKKDYRRLLIYFSSYENKEKSRRAGYAAIFVKNELCEVEVYYRGEGTKNGRERVQPVYVFQDGCAVEGEEIVLTEGMAADSFQTATDNFLRTGKDITRLEAIYLEGTAYGVCGGRVDGQALLGEDTYSVTKWTDAEAAAVKESEDVIEKETERVSEEKEHPAERIEKWSLSECMERLPELKLPFDGIRRKCCRMTIEDMERLPKEWGFLRENHFLLHGYYEYHHLLLGKLCGRHGERFVIGVPGEYGAREQYMAESFGFQDFSPLEQGKRRRGSFGYWYFYLTKASY